MKKISNELIKNFTTYKLSGKMPDIYIPESIEELKELLKTNKKYKILGKGSNLIISEKYDGIFIKLDNFNKLEIKDKEVKVGCAYSLSKLSQECAKKGLSGLEFACGIPGSIGGAVYMNAGAYGKNVSNILKEVTILDDKQNIKTLTNKQLNFGYRNSIFKENNYIILDATFTLENKESSIILKEISDIMESRRRKQPLEYPSAGSVFRNPEGYSAGRLIQNAELQGININDAEVSKKHANFIINKGNASAEDVIKLINIVKNKVKEKNNIELKLEQEIIK